MLNFLKYLLSAAIIAVVGLSAVWLALDKGAGFRLYSVQSGSMMPALRRGDLVLDARTSLARLKPGDVVSYFSPMGSGAVITHRVVSVNLVNGTFITKGDNLPQADAPVAAGYLIGQTLKIIPNLGYTFDAARRPLGLALVVYLPALLISLAELWLLAGAYRHRPYQLI